MVIRSLGLALLLICATAAGQSVYVSDELVVTLRTGPSTQNSILRNLRSGDRIQILETDAENGYARVRTSDGTEGWVLSRYLTAEPIAREQLAVNLRALDQARGRIGELEARVASLSGELAATGARLQDAEAANAAMTSELADIRSASANALTLRDQNESLRRRLNERDEQLNSLTTANAALRSSATREWFVVGAGVLLGGIIVGLVLPSMRRRRRSEW